MLNSNLLFNKDFTQIEKDYYFIRKVIQSCKTQIQLDNAKKLVDFFKQKHIKNPFFINYNL
jgi:capsule polysaccharide export protein KpsE/RkpR